jgi:PAS domain S-box-containing protein
MQNGDSPRKQRLTENQEMHRLIADLEKLQAEREETEQKLVASEVRYRRLFEAAQDGILILDAETGKITDANPFLTAMLGYSKEELLGKTLWEIGLIVDTHASRNAFIELQSKGYVRYEDLPLQTKDGRRAEVEFVSNTYAVNGEKVIQCNVRDITERKLLEKKLVSYERLAILGKVAGSLSHELRNPLAVVDSSIFYLDKTLREADSKTIEHLKRIHKAIERATRVIQSLLDLTEMNEPHLERTELQNLMSEIIISGDIPDTVKVVKDFTERDIFVKCDPEQIVLALNNIVTNAIQAMERKGTLTIAIGFKNSHAEVSVTDTGPGFTPEAIRMLFEPLFSTKVYGIGFGLAITRLVVERHNGSIEVPSKPGQGATVLIRLPLWDD